MVEKIFIDWDDTLVHNRRTVQAFKVTNQYHAIFTESGLQVPETLDDSIHLAEVEYGKLKSKDKTKKGKFYEILCSNLGIRISCKDTYLFLEDLYNERYAQMTTFMRDAEQFLHTLGSSFGLILISDGHSDRVNAQLRHLSLEKRFTDALFSDIYGFKIEGNIFDKARGMNPSKRKPIFIGDNPNVDTLATKYGFEVLLVNNGYSDYSQLPTEIKVVTFDQIARRLNR